MSCVMLEAMFSSLEERRDGIPFLPSPSIVEAPYLPLSMGDDLLPVAEVEYIQVDWVAPYRMN